MTQLIANPTRITANTSTLIDWFIANKPEYIKNFGVLHLGISDHSLIYGCRKIAYCKTAPKIIECRKFNKYKSPAFKDDLNYALSISDWGSNDPNVLWNQFRDIFNNVADIHAPITSRRVRSSLCPMVK